MTVERELFDQLIFLEQQFHKSEIRSSAAETSKLLAQDFCEFTSSGKIWSREDILTRLPAEDKKAKIEYSQFKVTDLSSEVTLVTYVSKRISSDGASLAFLRSSVWKKHSGQWLMMFHQGTIKN